MAKPRDVQALPKGTLELLILRGVERGPMHGYALARWIEQRSEGALLIEEGSLYPAVHRLERGGLLRGAWVLAESGRRARVYQLTTRGRKELKTRTTRWRELSGAISLVLGASLRPLHAALHVPSHRPWRESGHLSGRA